MRRVTRDDSPQPNAGHRTHCLADGTDDRLVREEPLLLSVHGQQLTTMRTPGRDEDLSVGFLLGEGVIASARDIAAIEIVAGSPETQQPDEARVTLTRAPDASVRGRLARTHEIRSSCGICGIADPSTLLDDLAPLLPGVPRIDADLVPRLVAALRQRQPLFDATGGSHGALVATAAGDILGVAEDVGRHNALDKAIGQAARAGANLAHAIAVVSGRMGYDLAIKCLRTRIAILVSVSAPSSLAFELCSAAGATLLGFARGEAFRAYTDSGRLSS
jgi:FdhD protein